MTESPHYMPGPATGAEVRKDSNDKWTLVLVRNLRHSPEKVWRALTDPAQLQEWAPFVVDGNLASSGTVNMTWVGTPQAVATKIARAEAPNLLEYGDMRWELEPSGSGTRLTLWHSIDRRYIAWGAAGWHICIDVLDHLINGTPLGRIVGPDAMKYEWQRLNAEYAKQFGVESPKFG